MAKTSETVAPPATLAEPAPASFPLSIEEFCTGLSQEVRLPEMVYAFSKHEMSNGRFRDTADNFKARFAAFGGRVPA